MKHLVAYGMFSIALTALCSWNYSRQNHAQLAITLLDASLQVANDRVRKEAGNIIKTIARDVAANPYQARDLEILHVSREIDSKAFRLTEIIKSERSRILKDSSSVYISNYTINQVNEYFDYVSPLAGNSYPELEAKLIHVPDLMFIGKTRKYEQLYREQSTAAELAGLLTQLESVINASEIRALTTQAQKVGRSWDGFFQIEPYATASSSTVAAGETYTAKLFLTASGGGRIVQMAVNGTAIPVGPDGRGNVKFVVPANAAKGKSYWEGTIRAFVQGHDSTFKLRVPYTVRGK